MVSLVGHKSLVDTVTSFEHNMWQEGNDKLPQNLKPLFSRVLNRLQKEQNRDAFFFTRFLV